MTVPDSIPYQFASKSEAFPPDPSSGFVGKQEVTISATCVPANKADDVTKEFTNYTATVDGSTDAEYATALYNALKGNIYMSFGYPDPDQL
tara:strand:- start:48 stop:320 length:273 start_codon:yes stop_codon:yes gene_type:complete